VRERVRVRVRLRVRVRVRVNLAPRKVTTILGILCMVSSLMIGQKKQNGHRENKDKGRENKGKDKMVKD
jgi:hypothetical protein